MAEVHSVSVKIGDIDLVFETGKIAKQANGAVYAHYAGSAVIATVCCGEAPSEPIDYVPVSVEYNEKYYAAGKIPGGFLKRESRPKDKEILVSRLIDRPMRPLFVRTTVFTAPISLAAPFISLRYGIIFSLYGIVTLNPLISFSTKEGNSFSSSGNNL